MQLPGGEFKQCVRDGSDTSSSTNGRTHPNGEPLTLRSLLPRTCLRTGTEQDNFATFTRYPLVQHSEVSSEREVNAEVTSNVIGAGGGKYTQDSAIGMTLPAAEENITTIVKAGTYEDCDLLYDLKEHVQMHVRVGVLMNMTGQGLESTGKLQLLDVKAISANKILVLREARMTCPTKYKKIDWPCGDDEIRSLK